MISVADLHPKSQKTYVGHMNLVLIHISFVSKGFMPVNFDLNLHIYCELFFCIVFYSVIYYINKRLYSQNILATK